MTSTDSVRHAFDHTTTTSEQGNIMPYGILIEDFIPLCCYLVQGDVTRSLSSLIRAVQDLRQRMGPEAYFGTGPQDFETAIVELLRLDGARDGNGIPGMPHHGPLALHTATVFEMVPRVMRFRCVRFDMGCVVWEPIRTDKERPERLVLIEGYFSAQWPPPPKEELLRTLVRLGWSDRVVATCLRGGGYRETLWNGYILEGDED